MFRLLTEGDLLRAGLQMPSQKTLPALLILLHRHMTCQPLFDAAFLVAYARCAFCGQLPDAHRENTWGFTRCPPEWGQSFPMWCISSLGHMVEIILAAITCRGPLEVILPSLEDDLLHWDAQSTWGVEYAGKLPQRTWHGWFPGWFLQGILFGSHTRVRVTQPSPEAALDVRLCPHTGGRKVVLDVDSSLRGYKAVFGFVLALGRCAQRVRRGSWLHLELNFVGNACDAGSAALLDMIHVLLPLTKQLILGGGNGVSQAYACTVHLNGDVAPLKALALIGKDFDSLEGVSDLAIHTVEDVLP